MNSIDRSASLPSAAYLYTLNLDPISLAWEYLRRNPDYQRDFRGASAEDAGVNPGRWLLRRWENPWQDSRLVEPIWQVDAGRAVTFVRGRARESVATFRFWSFAGDKTLRHDGDWLRLTTRLGSRVQRVNLSPDLKEDDPIAISISAGPGFLRRAEAAWALMQSFNAAFPAVITDEARRPSPRAVTHMQILQALDGDAGGASVREIARAIFGAFTDQTWGPDSVWRARVRYLLNRGQALSAEGYRMMVDKAVACPYNDESFEMHEGKKTKCSDPLFMGALRART